MLEKDEELTKSTLPIYSPCPLAAPLQGPPYPLHQKNCAGKGVRCLDRRGKHTIIGPASFRRLKKKEVTCNTAREKLVKCQRELNQ